MGGPFDAAGWALHLTNHNVYLSQVQANRAHMHTTLSLQACHVGAVKVRPYLQKAHLSSQMAEPSWAIRGTYSLYHAGLLP